jgi:hypothetical protein
MKIMESRQLPHNIVQSPDGLIEPPLDPIDILEDGRWHWVAGVSQGRYILKGEDPNHLWIHGTASINHGYYPRPKVGANPATEYGYRVDYYTDQDGLPYRGMDLYVSFGRVAMNDREVPVAITSWDAPDSCRVDGKSRSLFMRQFMPDEPITSLFFDPVRYV